MGKPGWSNVQSPLPEKIGQEAGTWGSETSQYPQEEKATCDSLSSGERNGNSPNPTGGKAWWRCQLGVVGPESESTRSRTELQIRCVVEVSWKDTPQWVTAPYTKHTWTLVGVPK